MILKRINREKWFGDLESILKPKGLTTNGRGAMSPKKELVIISPCGINRIDAVKGEPDEIVSFLKEKGFHRVILWNREY